MPQAILSLEQISKQFGPVRALKEVSLEFFPGEVLGLLGENGAGKSTLLRTLSGDYQPDSGSLLMDGEPVSFRAPRDAHAHGVHVVYQEPELVWDLTVAENLSLGQLPSVAGLVTERRTRRSAQELISSQLFDGIVDPNKLVRDCTPAERQCVEILKAVAGKVRVLCLDEPTSSLSAGESERLWQLMARLRAGGTTIIYVSHRMAEISQLCDRVAVMRDGELVAIRAADDIDEDEMISIMVGRSLGRLFPARTATIGAPVLQMHQVTTDSVTEVDLTVHAGEILGLAGLVGAGRTEIANAIYGVDRIHSGHIAIDGRRVDLRSPAHAMKVGINLSPEDRKSQGLFLDRSVSENVSLPLLKRLSRAWLVSRSAERTLVTKMTQRMKLKAHSLESLASTLSGGNQQKLLLARWVAMSPRLLILDEPTRGIDVGAKAEIYRLIDELTADGMAILVISSETSELLGLADRLLVVRDGRIIGDLPTSATNEEEILRLAIGTKEHRNS